MYNAQETLIPTMFHSLVMYAMIAVVAMTSLIRCQLVLSAYSIWYLVFFIICFISSAFFNNSDPGILFEICVSWVISFCLLQVISNDVQLESLLKVYVLSAIFMALALWYTGQLDFLYFSAMNEERLGTEVTGNANIFTALFMYAGVFAAWMMLYDSKRLNRLISLLLFCIIFFLMIVSGGRKTIIAIIGSLVLFIMLKKTKSIRHIVRNLAISIIIVVSIFLIIFHVPFLYDLIGERFEGLFNLFSGQGSEVSGDDTRKQIFDLAFTGWLERPLLGHGIDSFKFYNQAITGHFYYAHNNFVELLYDLGVTGFLSFYWIFFYIFRQLKSSVNIPYKFTVLGYGILIELMFFDLGGVSYYLVGNIIVLAIAYLCTRIKVTQ